MAAAPESLCARYGIDFPLFAFSHCRDVVAGVSRAGGLGVFGAALVGGPSPDRGQGCAGVGRAVELVQGRRR